MNVLFDGEKACGRMNRADRFAALTIAFVQRNGESIPVRAAGDLAQNQIRAWKIGNHQSGPALSAATIARGKGMTTISPATGLTTRYPLLVSSNRAPEQIRSARRR